MPKHETVYDELMYSANLIRRFVSNEDVSREWDDFTSLRSKKSELLAKVQGEIARIDRAHLSATGYCSPEGMRKIEALAPVLEAEAERIKNYLS